MDRHNRGAATEADTQIDTIGEQQLCRELSDAGLLTLVNEGEVAERAKLLV